MNTKLVALVAFAVVLGRAGAARADEGDPSMQGPPTKPPLRSGWTAGLAVGLGEVHLVPDEADKQPGDEGAGFSLRVGQAVSQTMLLQAIIEFVEGSGATNTVFGGAVQIYFSERFFFRGGGGITRFSSGGGMEGGESQSFTGVGVLGGIGGEWLQLQDLGLTGELMFMANRPESDAGDLWVVNGSFLVGIQWF